MAKEKMTAGSLIHEMTVTSRVLGRDEGIKIVFEGDQAATDGKTIFLPTLPLDATLDRLTVQQLRGPADHEACHIRFTDMETVIPWYNKLHASNRGVLKSIHNCIEDVWMESKAIERYQGTFKNLQAVEELLKKEGIDQIKEHDVDMSGITPMNVINVIKPNTPMFNVEGSYHRQLFEMFSPELRAHCDVWIKETMKAKDSIDCINIAKAIYKILILDPEFKDTKPEDFDPTSGEGEFEEGDGSITDEEKEAGLEVACTGDEEGEGEPTPCTILGGTPLSAATKLSAEINLDEEREYGGTYTVFSTERDKVYTRKGKHRNSYVDCCRHGRYEDYKTNLKGNISTMKNRLKRSLLAETNQRWSRSLDKGKIDPRKISKVALDNFNVFKNKDKPRLTEDTAITIMVDLSGSMGRDKGSKGEQAMLSTIALSECLQGSNYAFRVMGFTNNDEYRVPEGSSYSRVETLDTLVLKDFNDTLRSSRGAIASIQDAVDGNNTDYEFIFNEVEVLKKRPEKRKVLFVLSDGHPQHQGCISSREEMRLAYTLLQEAKKNHGIQSVGIGIQSSYVSKVYPEWVEVKNVSDLSGKVFNKLTKILLKGDR